jgi:HEAT repeat protein
MLRGADPGERQAAVGALALLGPHAAPALPDLRDALLTGRSDRGRLAALLAGIGPEGQKVLLDVAERGSDPVCWREVLTALAGRPGLAPATVRRVTGLLEHPDAMTRGLAAATLAAQGPAAACAVPALIEGLTDPALVRLDTGWDNVCCEGPTVHLAVAALARIGAPAVPALVEALESDNADRRQQAVIALGRIGPPARDARKALRKQLEGGHTSTRLHAAGALLRTGEDPEKRLRVLTAGLKDPGTRRLALFILCYGGTEVPVGEGACLGDLAGSGRLTLPKEAMEPLLGSLGDKGLGVWAAGLLGLMKGEAGELVPRLTALLREGDSRQRSSSLFALEKLGPAAAEAAPVVLRVLEEDGAPEVQALAARALEAIGGKAPTPAPVLLQRIAAQRALHSCDDLYLALGSLRPVPREVIDHLLNVQGAGADGPSSDGYRRSLPLRTLGQIGPAARAAVPALEARLLDHDPIVRAYATFALAAVTEDVETYLPRLLLAARDAYDVEERYPVRGFVLEGLKLLGPRAAKATPWLLEQLAQTGDGRADRERVRAVIAALGAIGPGARAALPRLRRLAARGEAIEAAEAADAVRRIERR